MLLRPLASFYAFLATLFLDATSLPLDVGVPEAELVLSINIPPTIDDVGKFTLSGTLKNAGAQTVSVVRDPDGLLFDHFPVGALSFTNTETGKRPNYIGAIVKWSLETYLKEPDLASPAPKGKRASDNSDDKDTNSDGGSSTSSTSPPGTIHELAPAQSMEIRYDVGEGYDFTDSGAGEYELKLARDYFWVLVDGEIVKAKVSMQGTVKITGALASSSKDAIAVTDTEGDNEKRDSRITTTQCTELQALDIYRAAESADQAVDDSLDYLKSHKTTGGGPRYEQWFGSWDAPPPIRGDQSVRPRDEVDRVFRTIQRFAVPAEPKKGYTYDCSCRINVYAFVRAKKTNTPIIHLCNWFRSSAVSIEGTDSKSGTLIHEATHFENAGHSFDIASSQEAAHELALRDPILAVASANNYEYFAENDPFLD